MLVFMLHLKQILFLQSFTNDEHIQQRELTLCIKIKLRCTHQRLTLFANAPCSCFFSWGIKIIKLYFWSWHSFIDCDKTTIYILINQILHLPWLTLLHLAYYFIWIKSWEKYLCYPLQKITKANIGLISDLMA